MPEDRGYWFRRQSRTRSSPAQPAGKPTINETPHINKKIMFFFFLLYDFVCVSGPWDRFQSLRLAAPSNFPSEMRHLDAYVSR